MCNENAKHWCSLVSSALGVVLGLGAFVAFFVIYLNYEAGIWGIISELHACVVRVAAVVAAVCLHMSYLAVRHRLDSWHSPDSLREIFWLGCISAFVGLSGLTWNVARTSVYQKSVLPVRDSSAISAVWAFMVAKWGLLVALHSRSYSRQLLSDAGAPLLPARSDRTSRW